MLYQNHVAIICTLCYNHCEERDIMKRYDELMKALKEAKTPEEKKSIEIKLLALKMPISIMPKKWNC